MNGFCREAFDARGKAEISHALSFNRPPPGTEAAEQSIRSSAMTTPIGGRAGRPVTAALANRQPTRTLRTSGDSHQNPGAQSAYAIDCAPVGPYNETVSNELNGLKIAPLMKRPQPGQGPKVYRVGTASRSAQEFGKRMDVAIEQKVREAVRYTRWLMGENA
jgi:hypothetical protein